MGSRVKSVWFRAPLMALRFRLYGQILVLGPACWGIVMKLLGEKGACFKCGFVRFVQSRAGLS